jgi:hypothetical protein
VRGRFSPRLSVVGPRWPAHLHGVIIGRITDRLDSSGSETQMGRMLSDELIAWLQTIAEPADLARSLIEAGVEGYSADPRIEALVPRAAGVGDPYRARLVGLYPEPKRTREQWRAELRLERIYGKTKKCQLKTRKRQRRRGPSEVAPPAPSIPAASASASATAARARVPPFPDGRARDALLRAIHIGGEAAPTGPDRRYRQARQEKIAALKTEGIEVVLAPGDPLSRPTPPGNPFRTVRKTRSATLTFGASDEGL